MTKSKLDEYSDRAMRHSKASRAILTGDFVRCAREACDAAMRASPKNPLAPLLDIVLESVEFLTLPRQHSTFEAMAEAMADVWNDERGVWSRLDEEDRVRWTRAAKEGAMIWILMARSRRSVANGEVPA